MASGLITVRRRVAEAAQRAGRDAAGIVVVGVSKYATESAIQAARAAGLRDFGENRADALVARARLLGPGVRMHFVGRLQGNKVKKVRPVVALLHSLDRIELCEPWMRGSDPPPPALVQVNVAGDPAKAGVTPSGAGSLVAAALGMGISVQGLMTVPPLDPDPEASRAVFSELRRIRDELRERHPTVVELSMGMSNDYEAAVEEGATILRVGRAIFGPFPDEG